MNRSMKKQETSHLHLRQKFATIQFNSFQYYIAIKKIFNRKNQNRFLCQNAKKNAHKIYKK